MRRFLALPLLALAPLSFGLTIGDKAPPLMVAATVKGAPVNLAKGVHVVEFWATWCGPCKVSIPHLTEMAKKYKGKADFTGVSVWENGPDQIGQVKKFVAAMGPKMDYNVAFDGDKKAMATNWMTAAKQNGIPAAFLVKDGKVLWIGHPMDGLDEAVGSVLAGTFDAAAAKAKFAAEMAQQAKAEKEQAEMMTLMKPFSTAIQAKNYDGALKVLDDVEAKRPDLKARLEPTRFQVLLTKNSPKLLELAQRFASDDYKDNAPMLNQFAWSIIDPASKVTNSNYAAALLLAERAARVTDMKDPMILDTYALALYRTGDKKGALEIQTKVVDLYADDKAADPATLKEFRERLGMYKKDAA